MGTVCGAPKVASNLGASSRWYHRALTDVQPATKRNASYCAKKSPVALVAHGKGGGLHMLHDPAVLRCS